MPSVALNNWRGRRAAALDEIEAAHRGIGGSGRGRRYATEQINHAYAMLLSSQFQGYCRDLHVESTNAIIRHPSTRSLVAVLIPALTQGRKLDAGNPNPGNIGSDFNRFGISFWDRVLGSHVHGVTWQKRLERLNRWRNAIAHQDFDPATLGAATLRLQEVRVWRRACNGLAVVGDEIMRGYIFRLIGAYPW